MAIQQKLQTKLAQKLILTPSLPQAIKLLPMSTWELADLLNQEVVEHPLLEEVPTEDLAAAEQTPQEKEGGEEMEVPMSFGPQVAFTHTFDKPGPHKVWAQVEHDGQVLTFEWVVVAK